MITTPDFVGFRIVSCQFVCLYIYARYWEASCSSLGLSEVQVSKDGGLYILYILNGKPCLWKLMGHVMLPMA